MIRRRSLGNASGAVNFGQAELARDVRLGKGERAPPFVAHVPGAALGPANH